MTGFIIVALIFVLIWLASRLRAAERRLDELGSTLAEIEYELRKSQAQPAPGLVPAVPAPTPPPLPVEPVTLVPAPEITASEPPPASTGESEPQLENLVPPPAFPQSLPNPPKLVDWEQFLGVKLFAWIGGLALFLGIAFFLKFSFERNLIPPAARIAMGFATGAGLIIGGILMRRKDYQVTAHTLCATGVVALYGSAFAAHGLYHLIGTGTTFALMTAITAAAFVLSVRLQAVPVAVLGIVGGFLTPPLLSSGVDRPVSLFGYVLLLNCGLLAVAFKQGWHFLILLGVLGTTIMEGGWFLQFFNEAQPWVAFRIFILFLGLFVLAYWHSERRGQANDHAPIAVLLQALLVFGLAAVFTNRTELAQQPALLLPTVFLADLALIALGVIRPSLFKAHLLGAILTFLLLAGWINRSPLSEYLYWIFGAVLVFALLHSAVPLLLQRRLPVKDGAGWATAAPVGALLLLLLLTWQFSAVPLVVWPVVLLVNGVLLLAAFYAGSLASGILAALLGMLITGGLMSSWMLRAAAPSQTSVLSVIGLFALFFCAVSSWFIDRKLQQLGGEKAGDEANPQLLAVFPAAAALMPFALLGIVIVTFKVANPAGVFSLALALSLVLLWLAAKTGLRPLPLAALGAALIIQDLWVFSASTPDMAGAAVAWHMIFYCAFLVFPFIYRGKFGTQILPWAIAALAGPLHFFFIRRAAMLWLGPISVPGVIPAIAGIPVFIALAVLFRRALPEQRNALLAWFGGSALFFITAIFPIQFEKQWLTIAFAVEGLALAWLFRKLPHPGLPPISALFLTAAFARLALNWSVFQYHPRSGVPLLNWYLYTYGVVSACLFIAGHLLRTVKLPRPPSPLLFTLGTILTFILLNIQIADFFADGPWLHFEFSGDFARDMTYSIAWALFALALLIIGIARQLSPVRYASLGLLVVTLLKLFLHDLSQLGQLYRIGAFIGVAIILIVASWLYQRFLAASRKPE